MRKNTLLILILSLILVLSQSITAFAEEEEWIEIEEKTKIHGSVDGNYTYDTRDMNRLTLNTLIFFPYGISYYNVFHLNSLMAVDGGNFDLDNYYHEQDIWWNVYRKVPVDLVFQWQSMSGANNDQARFGFRWRISDTPWIKPFCEKIHLFLTTQVHAFQTDFNPSAGWGFSFEHFWRMQVLPSIFNDRVYIAGYMDHNLDYGGATAGNNSAIVTETQIGVKVYGNLNVIAEYRYSDYDARQHGVGFGLEYIVNF